MKDFVCSATPPSSGGVFAPKKAATVLDVCSGRTDHLNMKRVVSVEPLIKDFMNEG